MLVGAYFLIPGSVVILRTSKSHYAQTPVGSDGLGQPWLRVVSGAGRLAYPNRASIRSTQS